MKLHNRQYHKPGDKLRDLHTSSVFITLKNNVSQTFSNLALWVIVIIKKEEKNLGNIFEEVLHIISYNDIDGKTFYSDLKYNNVL